MLVSSTFNHLEHCRILFEHKMGGITSIIQDHVWLPSFSIDTLVYAPPKILLGFSSPCKYRIACVYYNNFITVISTYKT